MICKLREVKSHVPLFAWPSECIHASGSLLATSLVQRTYEVLLHNESSAVKGAYHNMATQTLTASVGLK